MDQSTLEALLGRSLTTTESTNLKLYLKIARENLDGLLCTNLCDQTPTRTFDVRAGYRTVFTDIFTSINSVTLNGVATTDYVIKQWDNRNANWYNSIVFSEALNADDEVQVDAVWGFISMPSDLQMVLAGLFDLITKKNNFDGTITQKRVEDFQINFNPSTDLDDEFYRKYNTTISKYSHCDMANVQSGATNVKYCL